MTGFSQVIIKKAVPLLLWVDKQYLSVNLMRVGLDKRNWQKLMSPDECGKQGLVILVGTLLTHNQLFKMLQVTCCTTRHVNLDMLPCTICLPSLICWSHAAFQTQVYQKAMDLASVKPTTP